MSDNIDNKINIVTTEAKLALDQMKTEAAREMNIADNQAEDRGNLTSRQNGYVGGYINKNSNIFDKQMDNNRATN